MPARPRPHSPGGGDGGDPPPPRRHTTGGPDGGDAPSIAAAQAQVTGKAQDGHLGARARANVGGSGAVGGPAATTPLRPPNALRHNLNSVKLNSRSKDKNTIVLPGTDVAGDLADISAGRGTWDSVTNQYRVNGRTYGVEPGGTTFPIEGPGFVRLERSPYKVLKNLIGNDGDIAATREALRRDPSVSEADWTIALEVFQHHKNYRGGA
ncbi:hypothetical protein [Paractinoplanes brasiliensis]|uniref:Uncharacterized protein n=1 Tax=Paractinoplanes brasiliensis TaxID=52695 RepID=A0A4R6JWV3_9ACTN|nr:hypothetical protein [Actinoplanes brasiliensis]TDO39686.1 hypothetical protein C8E87_3382 [Actinoplanes brasiliensis]GID28976.1 hypothetical protein Abr02nite_39590 [Actinoplanes brasiliensis]